MNENHYPAGSEKGGQFAPKNKSLNGGFTKENQSFDNEDKIEPLKERQDISTYKHYQKVIQSVLGTPDYTQMNQTIQKNMFDICASSPIFDSLFLDEVVASNKQYIGGYEGIVSIANDEDDKSGIDFALGKEHGGLSRFDLKANYSTPGKIKLRIDKTMFANRTGQAEDSVADDFFLKQDGKTNYYAFMSVDNANLNTRYNQRRIFDAIKEIYNDPDLSEEEKHEELNIWVNENIVDSVTAAHCNVISRNDLQRNIYRNTGLNEDALREKSLEMRFVMDDVMNNPSVINQLNMLLGTNYRFEQHGKSAFLLEDLKGSQFPIQLVHRIDRNYNGTPINRTTYYELDEKYLEAMNENKRYDPFSKKLDKNKKDDNLKSRLLEKFKEKLQ